MPRSWYYRLSEAVAGDPGRKLTRSLQDSAVFADAIDERLLLNRLRSENFSYAERMRLARLLDRHTQDVLTYTEYLNVVQPVAESATADPTQLPIASNQAPNTAAYDALGVPGMSAGDSYNDPTTGVLIYKISDETTPVGSQNRVVPDYAHAGPRISRPWTSGGKTYYTLHFLVSTNSDPYFVDFNYTDGTFSNWRAAPWYELDGCFSYAEADPRIAYYLASNGRIQRYDTGAMELANTGNFPSPVIATAPAGYLNNDIADTWFALMKSRNIYTWNSQTNDVNSWGTEFDSPILDRGGTYLMGNYYTQETLNKAQGVLADGPPWACTNIRTNCSGGSYLGQQHLDCTSIGWSVAHNVNPGMNSYQFSDYYSYTQTGNKDSSAGHNAAQWSHTLGNGSTPDVHWALHSSYKTSASCTVYEAIAFRTVSPIEIRLVAHHYSDLAADNYWAQAHASLSPDGKLIVFGSSMNNGGRIDSFLVRVPTA